MECSKLRTKKDEFNEAMRLYTQKSFYTYFNFLISASNITLQIALIFQLAKIDLPLLQRFICFILAYLFADFINGLVHLYMDNNENYQGFAGPFIANFHLHHKRPRYQKKPLPLIYFFETGSKVWLLPTQAFIFALTFLGLIPSSLAVFLIYFSILSSVAEVSHYLCHTINARWVTILGDLRILLPRKHHALHHAYDNMNYAFLNGVSDPLLNFIAKHSVKGYKKTTDLHFADYDMANNDKRE